MKRLIIIALILIASTAWGEDTIFYGTASGGGGIQTASNCNQAQYFTIGVLCQDTDDGKLYKGTGAAVVEIAAGSSGDVTAAATAQTWGDGTGPIVWTYGVTGTDPTITVTTGAFTLNTSLALGSNNITTTGSLGATGAGKLTKGWFTDIESTNYPTVNGVAVFDQDVSADGNPSFSTINVVGANSLNLGTAGSLVGGIRFKNATSGYVEVLPPTGALATGAITLPASGTLATTGQIPTAATLHVDDVLTALGIASEATSFGTFTGTTISDNVTGKAALQALETAVEGKQATDADLTAIAALACAENEIIKRNGSAAWVCAADATAGGGVALDDITNPDAAKTFTLLDNNASALSLGSTGKADIIKVITTDAGEGVTMSGTLGVTGVITATGGVSGNASTATALAADPANCAAGQIALGITAAGVAECTATPSGLTSVGATTFTGALTGTASGNAPLNPLATDTIWDAAGDLVQGSGANTAAKLTKGAEGTILRAGATSNAYTTATYPATTTTQRLLYSTAANVVGELSAVNNGIVAFSPTGVLGAYTNLSSDDSAYQFYSATASKGTLKFDQTGISDTKQVVVKYTAADNYTFTPTLTGNTGITYPTSGTLLNSTATGVVERIGATFDGGGSAIAVNKIAYVHIPYAITTINQWTVVCDVDSGATGIIITPYMDAYAADTLPTTTMCTTGTPPHTTDGAGAGGLVHQAAWDCNIAAIPADRIIGFKVTTAPSSATWCTVSLKATR